MVLIMKNINRAAFAMKHEYTLDAKLRMTL